MALKAKLIIASATVATTGAATGAVVGISTLATNSADSPIQFEPHTLNEALKVNDSTGTMDVTVAETFTESFVIPETHFLKDGQNVDNLFTWVNDWSTSNLKAKRTVKLTDATDPYWRQQDLSSSLDYQIEVITKGKSKLVDFNIKSQNSITNVKVVSNNLQVGVASSQAIIAANTKGFAWELLTIDTKDTGLVWARSPISNEWIITLGGDTTSGSKTIYLNGIDSDSVELSIHIDSWQKVIASVTHNDLQQGNANSYATIELDAENDADLTNIVYEDTTADLNENQKLSLSWNDTTNIITATPENDSTLASGVHTIKITPSEEAQWEEITISLDVFTQTQEAISAIVIDNNLQRGESSSTATIKVTKFNITTWSNLQLNDLSGLIEGEWSQVGDIATNTIQWDGANAGDHVYTVSAIDALGTPVTTDVNIWVRDTKQISVEIYSNEMTYGKPDTTAEVRIRMIDSYTRTEDLRALTCDLLDSGLTSEKQENQAVATFTFKPGTATVGSHDVKIVLDENHYVVVALPVHKDVEKKIQFNLDFNTLNIETKTIPVTATLTTEGFTTDELPTNFSAFAFGDKASNFDIAWNETWASNASTKFEFSLKNDTQPGSYPIQIGIPAYDITTDVQNIDVVTDYNLALPQTADFFTFDTTTTTNDTITGYADAFVASWINDETLNAYLAKFNVSEVNMLSFANKFLSSEVYAFSPENPKYTNLNTFYKKIGKLSFHNTTWKWALITDQWILSLINSPGPCIATATTAFGGLLNPDESITNAANFNNVTSIDWTNVNFGEDEIPDSLFSGQVASVATSPLSFVGVNFSQLKDLDFKHASFAGHFAENSPAMGNILVSTATLTFYACDFSSLEELNLSGVSFASSGMSRGNVKTAESTFTHSNFSNIRFFSLGQTIFAVTGMIIGDNSQTRIVTASNSFFAADFSNVETFSTAGAVFGALHPCTTNPTSCEIDTAYNTFGDSIWTNLKRLNISYTDFTAVSSSDVNVHWVAGAGLFAFAVLTSLETLFITDLTSYTQANGSSDTPNPNYNVGNGIDATAFHNCVVSQQINVYGSQNLTYWQNAPWYGPPQYADTIDVLDYWFPVNGYGYSYFN